MLAPVAGFTARSLPGKVPPAISRPPVRASSVTLPEARLALTALSTAPVVGFSLATPRRATPLTLGANEDTTPVEALKATMLLRAKVPPG